MKKILYLSTLIFFAYGCKPELKGELGEPSNKVEGLNGNWQMTAFSQRDENNPIKEVRDMSEYYIIPGEDATKLTFNSSDNSYTIIPGPGRNYMGTGGTWRFDNNEAPTYLILESATDTMRLTLGSMPNPASSQLNLELPRYCTDSNGNQTPTVSYIFTIQRTN